MPGGLIKILQFLVALALPLMLLLGNVQLLMHERFVHYEYGRADFPADTAIPPGGYPLSQAERTALAERALASIIGPRGMQVLEEARFQDLDAPAFNAREIRHMRDVRRVFNGARIVFWVALGVLSVGGGLLGWKRRDALLSAMLVSVMATLAAALSLGLYILLSFGSFFTRFHRVFFEGSTWLFRRDDTLIRLFPTQFWFDAAVIIAGLTVVELLALGGAAWWWRRKKASEV
jgi:integral membrane protein (TIGR01906 family)